MRYYNEKILDEIRRELAFIFAAHRIHKLEGKMRIFSVANQDHWKSHESGFEFWFGPEEIDQAVNKIQLFYRGSNLPNTAFLLDPVLYHKEGREAPQVVGSGIIWATVLCNGNEEVPEVAIKRLKDLGLFVSPLHYRNNKNSGLKILGFLHESVKPDSNTLPQDGSIIHGIQSISDLVNINSNALYAKHYLLSGLEYRVSHGSYQHPNFMEMFDGKEISSAQAIRRHMLYQKRILDAAICWNAYDRNQTLYERYGIDVANLEQNLKSRVDTDQGIEEIKAEINLIWEAHLKHGLTGQIRLFTAPDQKHWRSKDSGFEFWFGPEEMDEAARQIKLYYNGGLRPNSPLLLDPVVYRLDKDGKRTPVGSGVVWCTAFALGSVDIEPAAMQRLEDTGVHASLVRRGVNSKAGIKILGLLEKPYLFTEDDLKKIEEKRKQRFEEYSEAIRQKRRMEIRIKAAKGDTSGNLKAAEEELTFEKFEEINDAIPIPGCNELFQIVNTNGEDYWPYYILSGLEYLSLHGAYQHEQFKELFKKPAGTNGAKPHKKEISLQRIFDAAKCWNAYDRHHSLWARFGIDVIKLEDNLKYFNLCARDFVLLDATGGDRKDLEERFEFFVPGWIPRGAVTVIGATGGTGKSSIAHRLAIIAATDWEEHEQPLWMGERLNKKFAKGLSIYFSGEDGAAIINARAELMDPLKKARRLMFQRTDFGENSLGEKMKISEFLRELDKLPDVSCVVIDPARKYLEGDEEDSEAVNTFFLAIEEFAIKKSCAMVVVHHLVKGAKPKDNREIIDLLRGSQVFIDRPRVVIGMYRDGPYIVCGLAKNNIPPNLGMVEGERIFVRDSKTLDLVWLPGSAGHRSFTVSEEELEQIKLEAEAKANLERISQENEAKAKERADAVERGRVEDLKRRIRETEEKSKQKPTDAGQ